MTPAPRFEIDSTRVFAGRSRIIAFRDAPSDSDRTLAATSSDTSVLDVLREPAIVAGSEIGFVRVRGKRAGDAVLIVGGTSLTIHVVGGTSRDPSIHAVITSPATGAAVWGTFAVGVEEDLLDGGDDQAQTSIRLHLSTGVDLEPDASRSPRQTTGAPVRRYTWTVDTAQLPAGPLALSITGAGEVDPVVVRVIHPGEADLTAGEAEETYDAERPERFKRNKLQIGVDQAASGGKFLNNGSAEPALCFPIHVASPGMYQVCIVAGGTLAAGALPTVGLIVDGAQQPVTNCRLASEQWHRLALGVPVRLEAGDHILTPYFLNDFYAGKLPGGVVVDRNLKLDRIEVARLAGPSVPGASGGDGSMMMAAAAQEQADASPMAAMKADSAMAATDGSLPEDPVMAAMPRDEMGESGSPLRIALPRPLDGLPLTGSTDIEPQVWVAGLERGPADALHPPLVSLVVNGEPIACQWSLAPRFLLDTGHLHPGVNTIEVAARLPNGFDVRTPPQRVEWSPPVAASMPEARSIHRFTALDPRWDSSIAQRLTREQQPRERVCAAFFSNGEAVLNLPEDLAGRFELSIEARGQDFKGPAVATVRLRTGVADAQPVSLGESPIPARWDTRRIGDGAITLATGPKQLIVSFENDAYEPPTDGKGGGDRNLWLQAVVLAEPAPKDAAPPRAEIAYPASGQPVFGSDVVITNVADDRELATAELLIDGSPTGIRLNARNPGPIVFPLLLRGVSPGDHSISVRATDAAGNGTTSDTRTIHVLGGPPATLGPYERALRLLDRFAFGPDQAEIAAVLIRGENAWLRDRLSRPMDDPGDESALAEAIAQIPGRGPGEVQRRAMLHALLTPNPVRARFVLWAENHFSTWVRKTEGPRKWTEHIAFSRLGAAPFQDLLLASAHSPAMLRYLDQENSYASKLNENYAREIMELHTLGVHGGYSQQDVTSLAHLLTGWTTSREGDGRSGGESALYAFRFDPLLNDRAAIRVIGIDFPQAIGPPIRKEKNSPASEGVVDGYDRIRLALETLAAHPSTARFVSRKLAEHYVGFPAPDGLVEDLASVFARTGGDMREMLLAIAAHPAFWAGATPQDRRPAPRLAHPFDYAVRLARQTRRTNAGHVCDFLGRTGNGLFDRATPDGYPEADSAYTDSNAMVQRWRFAQDLAGDIAALVPDPWKQEPPKPARKPGDASQPSPPPDDDAEWAQRVVDLLAVRLTGRLLGEESNAAALQILSETPGRRAERIQKFAPFIAQLPEANLR